MNVILRKAILGLTVGFLFAGCARPSTGPVKDNGGEQQAGSIPATASATIRQLFEGGENTWQECVNSEIGFKLEYPADWYVWERGNGEDVRSSCESADDYRFFGPDIYRGERPPKVILELYSSSTPGTIYYRQTSLDEALVTQLAKGWGPLFKSTYTADGSRMLWFGQTDNPLAVSEHGKYFLEFRTEGADIATFNHILQSLVFDK